ncbi:hypothetical protein K469DRAFT_595511 [Zopfia rhizophila CBS 207.26]|uniref:Zn(2)-C6 fungal-type domain-containing protein n=1 Tax=Zopfia rhizophila CBS 207.26 TaxID=1314779 RepID=A0A6A6DKS6_9PEZI|nr:hypothetical protein K469DRAFT_595511 [Zopfia rhizophila CBS 207.26]
MPRRPHTKSRHGCARCKRKKVKCDETRPQCKRCFTVDAECEYVALSRPPVRVPTATNHSPQGHEAGQYSAYSLVSSQAFSTNGDRTNFVDGNGTFGYLCNFLNSQTSSSRDLNLTDLKLMRQYCTSTFHSLDLDGVTMKEWQVIVPEIAEQYPFLMHGILSASALHLAVIVTDNAERVKWRSLSLGHLDLGLTVYMSLLGSITPENCNALFAFSGLLPLLSFGYPITDGTITQPPQGSPQAIDGIISLITLLRGIHTILNTSSRWVADGPLRNIIRMRERTAEPRLDVSEDTKRQLQQLCALNETLQKEEPEKQAILDQVIGKLQNIFYLLHVEPERPSALMMWPLGVNESYLLLLKSGDSMAMVLLAYWGATFKYLDNVWALHGWGRYIVDAACSTLDEKFGEILRWPREQVELQTGD